MSVWVRNLIISKQTLSEDLFVERPQYRYILSHVQYSKHILHEESVGSAAYEGLPAFYSLWLLRLFIGPSHLIFFFRQMSHARCEL